jgi:hypothetical protein
MTSTTPDATAIAERYIALWNEGDPSRRRRLIAQTWTEDARYVDPLMRGDGYGEIDAMIAAVQQRFPGHRFVLKGTPEGYADRIRFGWTLASDSAVVAHGTDFGVVAPDGRLRDVTGFLDYVAQ